MVLSAVNLRINDAFVYAFTDRDTNVVKSVAELTRRPAAIDALCTYGEPTAIRYVPFGSVIVPVRAVPTADEEVAVHAAS